MTTAEMLRAVSDCGCPEPATRCGCWEEGEDQWVCRGESADGVPDWTIEDTGGYWTVEREIGWYKQIGEADSLGEVVMIARAMDAAYRAFDAALGAAKRHP